MAKHSDIKAALDFIRQGYSGGDPFRFTTVEMAGAVGTTEKKTRDVLRAINTRARFWRGDFPAGNDFVVSAPVFERIRDWFN